MSEHGATLQALNQELVKSLEDLKFRRSQVQSQIDADEEEKKSLQKEIERLEAKLVKVNNRLITRMNAKDDCDKLIAETETAYVKIVKSSHLLVNMFKKEASNLDQNLVKANSET